MRRMVKVQALAVLLIFGALSLVAQSPNDVLGKWLTADGRSHIEIYKPADKATYFGKISWLKDPLDENGQPFKGVNGELILNLELLKDFNFDDGEWVDGTIYDPESGKVYYCTLELDGMNKLKVRGSVDSWGLLGRTEVWTRVL